MATTEEMNVTIALYMGLVYENGHLWRGEEAVANFLFEYNLKWGFLMQVWDKLRGELEAIKSVEVQMRKNNIAINLYNVNITTAHRLIYEAITWLSQNKEK